MQKQNKIQHRIAIASGKGGTGKTTIAVNLARILENQGVALLDCDVEEPNAHLFLQPDFTWERPVSTFVPQVDEARCTACGKCSHLCQYNTIVTIKDKVLVFPELCHACEGCKLICPESAISDSQKEIGIVAGGHAGSITFVHGKLRIGEAMSPPLIREVQRVGFQNQDAEIILIDAPPGTTCPVIQATRDNDLVILVTEPTPFGLHDLKLAVEMVRVLGTPFGLVINRSTIGNRDVWKFCEAEGIPILQEIPDDRRIAEAYSRGELIVDALPQYRETFQRLWEKAMEHLSQTAEDAS